MPCLAPGAVLLAEGAVKPEHVVVVIAAQRHHEDHPLFEGVVHRREAALLDEVSGGGEVVGEGGGLRLQYSVESPEKGPALPSITVGAWIVLPPCL